jgi:hypothetical protein
MSFKDRTIGKDELKPTNFESLERLLYIIKWVENSFHLLAEANREVDAL